MMGTGDELLGAGNLFEDTPAVPDVSMPAPTEIAQAKSLGNILYCTHMTVFVSLTFKKLRDCNAFLLINYLSINHILW